MQWDLAKLANTSDGKVVDVYKSNQTFPNTTQYLLGFNEPNKLCAWLCCCSQPGAFAYLYTVDCCYGDSFLPEPGCTGARQRFLQRWRRLTGRSWKRCAAVHRTPVEHA